MVDVKLSVPASVFIICAGSGVTLVYVGLAASVLVKPILSPSAIRLPAISFNNPVVQYLQFHCRR